MIRSHPKTLITEENGIGILADMNGLALSCAFRNPFLVVEKQTFGNKTDMQDQLCCSQCPHFHFVHGKEAIHITCGGDTVEHPITKSKEPKKINSFHSENG